MKQRAKDVLSFNQIIWSVQFTLVTVQPDGGSWTSLNNMKQWTVRTMTDRAKIIME